MTKGGIFLSSPKLHKAVRLLTSVMLILSGLCLIFACLAIYRTGEFTPAAVSLWFGRICIPIYITLALVAVSFFLPRTPEKNKAPRQVRRQLARLRSRADLEHADPQLLQEIDALLKARRHGFGEKAIVTSFCAAMALAYWCNPRNFHQSMINASVAKAALVLLPLLSLPISVWLRVDKAALASMEQEMALLKQAPTLPAAPKEPAQDAPSRLPIQAVLVVLALALLIFGALTGGTADVLTKAVNICTECVGLG